MDLFTIVSVWYSKNKFIFNNLRYPFLHNIQYHAIKYNYIVIYFIEDETNISIPTNDNVTYINFKEMFNNYLTELIAIKQKANKIDLMKNILIKECNKIKYKYFLLMDMDCEILDIDIKKIKKSNKFIIPFFDKSIQSLKIKSYNYLDSYIENYAFLINKNNKCSNFVFKNEFFSSDESNCFIYEQYINFVISYYKQSFNIIFPQKSIDLNIFLEEKNISYKGRNISLQETFLLRKNIFNPVTINFERGNSWKDDSVSILENIYNQKYNYDRSIKPIYNRDKRELYINILSGNINKIITNIIYFKKHKYNFKSYFNWSNSLQSNVNLYGVLIDRIEDINSLNKIKKLDFYQEVIKM